MFGIHIKRRGWVKSFNLSNKKLVCCRNASDIHEDLVFNTEKACNNSILQIKELFKIGECECREILRIQRIDKRLIPHKKIRDGFLLRTLEKGDSANRIYCIYCGLQITDEEFMSKSGICVHCLKFIYDELKKRYEKIDDDIKSAWERAKLMDEI